MSRKHTAGLFSWRNYSGWLAMAVLWAGCTTGGRQGSPPANEPSGPIDTLVLLSAPAAVDFDPAPGPDGIAVRLFATSQAKSKVLAISQGKIEVLMFDGVINDQTAASVQPLRVWTRTAAELQPFANKTDIGVSYKLTFFWEQARPKQDNITIIARYVAQNGETIYSAPSTIPVGGRRP